MSLPQDPFGELALCLSGGGYRAASFHLGSMSYLNGIEYHDGSLLHRVKAMSTVSGGTITGVLYALMNNQGSSFEEFYDHLMYFLKNHDLIAESLKKLKTSGTWNNTTKSKNLINAFAEIYDELLTSGATLNKLTENKNGHLNFCCFNSTEFSTGINFRFQFEWRERSQNRRLRRGNSNFTYSFPAQNEIKLADIIAASSCFPGGFEPINFPKDFTHKNSDNLSALLYSNVYKGGIGLMDGGIYDNQGIDSIQLSEKRRGAKWLANSPAQKDVRLPYDILIISDVSSPDIAHPFEFHETQQRSMSHYNLKKAETSLIHIQKSIFWIPVLMIIGGIVMGLMNGLKDNTVSGVAVMLTLFGIILWALGRVIHKRFRAWYVDIQDLIKTSLGGFFLNRLAVLDFKDYTLKDVEALFFDRINSVSLMIQEVFLKQVRRLKYQSIYEDQIYENRRIANLIKGLTRDDWSKTREYQDLKNIDNILKGNHSQVVGRKIKSLAEEASSFGTTLWFTDQDILDETLNKLVALGQVTMCFNLMVHITKLKNHHLYKEYPIATKRAVTKVFNQCKSDWGKFRSDPLFMVNN